MQQAQVQLAGIMLQETGTYNAQYSRPYVAKTTDETLNILGNRIGDVSRANPMAKISGSLISGLCGDLVVPAAAWDHELSIVHGWNEKRLRFSLEVHVVGHFGTEIYFFQGYTSHYGISLQGTIDPNMLFFINSFMRINRAQDFSGLSSTGFRDTIVESAQVIDGRIHAQQNTGVYGLRPEDIFTGVQSNYMTNMHNTFGDAKIIDDRINKSGDVFRSRRSNAIPSNFLSRVVESYRSAATLADYGGGTDDIYGRAIQTSYEGNTYENPFIRALSTLKGIPNITSFSMNDLMMIDPTINTRTDYQKLMDTVHLHHTGDTDNNWGNALLETQLATILTHAVSGLMLDNMLISVGFHVTNMTMNMSLDTRLFPGGQAVTTADMRQYYANFVHRLETEVMPDITKNNMIPVDITVYADLYGETEVLVSIDGKPHEKYVTPSFCDALMTPVVTTNHTDYSGLVTGIEEIVNFCGMASTAGELATGRIIRNL